MHGITQNKSKQIKTQFNFQFAVVVAIYWPHAQRPRRLTFQRPRFFRLKSLAAERILFLIAFYPTAHDLIRYPYPVRGAPRPAERERWSSKARDGALDRPLIAG